MRNKNLAKVIAPALAASLVLGACSSADSSTAPAKESAAAESAESAAEESAETENISEAADEEGNGWLVEEETTITMSFGSNYEFDENTWIFQKIKERTGIQVEPIVYPSESKDEKASAVIASGALPDIMFWSLSETEINEYGEQGAFANVLDYVDVMPNFKALILDDADMNEIYQTYTTESGKNYQIPIYRLNRDINHGNLYRADVFEELGIAPWTDTEGFYNALVALKEAYPDSYPLATSNGKKSLERWMSEFGINNADVAYDYDKQEWYIGCTSDAFKEYLDFFQKLYTEGLMDPEFLDSTVDTYNEAFLNNEAFVCNEWIGRMSALDNAAKENDANTTFSLEFGYPIGTGHYEELPQLEFWGNAVANNENTEVSMKLIDWLYSDEGSEIMTIGVEGENFEWDESGTAVYPELEGSTINIGLLEEKYGMWIEGAYLHPDRRSCYFAFTEKEQAAQDLVKELGNSKDNPKVDVAAEDTADYNLLITGLTDELSVFRANYITNASYGDAQWEEFVNKVTAEYGEKLLSMLNK